MPLTRPARHLSPLWSEGIYERAHNSDQSLFCKPTNHRRLSQHYPSTDVAGFLLDWDMSAPGFDYFVILCKHLWLNFVEKCHVPDTIASDIHKYVKLAAFDEESKMFQLKWLASLCWIGWMTNVHCKSWQTQSMFWLAKARLIFKGGRDLNKGNKSRYSSAFNHYYYYV